MPGESRVGKEGKESARNRYYYHHAERNMLCHIQIYSCQSASIPFYYIYVSSNINDVETEFVYNNRFI